MNEFFKNLLERTGSVWKKWTFVQRIIFIAILGGGVAGIVLLAAVSASPSMVPLLYRSIPNESEMSRIAQRLDGEGIAYQITSDARILVADNKTAQRMRAVFVLL